MNFESLNWVLLAGHYQALGRVIHAVNLKDQLNLNLDDERADIQLVDQLEILADTFYIKVNLKSRSRKPSASFRFLGILLLWRLPLVRLSYALLSCLFTQLVGLKRDIKDVNDFKISDRARSALATISFQNYIDNINNPLGYLQSDCNHTTAWYNLAKSQTPYLSNIFPSYWKCSKEMGNELFVLSSV